MQVGNAPKNKAPSAAAVSKPTVSHSACTGTAGQKGRVMGILRSLGALARALGPVLAAAGECGLVLLPLLFLAPDSPGGAEGAEVPLALGQSP